METLRVIRTLHPEIYISEKPYILQAPKGATYRSTVQVDRGFPLLSDYLDARRPAASSVESALTKLDIEGWHSRIRRRSGSENSVNIAKTGYKAFQEYLQTIEIETDQQLEEWLSLPHEDIYKFLDNFVGYLQRKNRMPATIHIYYQVAYPS